MEPYHLARHKKLDFCFKGHFFVRLFLNLTLVLLLGFNISLAGAKEISIEDITGMTLLSGPELSPDGKYIALIISRPDFGENQYKNQLLQVNVNNGAQIELTHGRHAVRSPKWSPDGKSLAFLAADKNQITQIFNMSLNGGEAKQITNSSVPVFSFLWRPNGHDIAYVRMDVPTEKTGIERHNKSYEIANNDILKLSETPFIHIWMVSVATGETRKLTEKNESINSFFITEVGVPYSWSPDGKLLAYSSQMSPHSSDYTQTVIKILDLSENSRRIFSSGLPLLKTSPAFSNDGKYLAYKSSVGPETLFTPFDMFIKPVAGGDEKQLAKEIDRSLSGAVWMADGKSMLVNGFDHTSKGIWKINLEGKVERLDWNGLEPLGAMSVNSKDAIAFIGADPKHPQELYYASSLNSMPKRLTSFNEQLASLEAGKVDSINWKSPDGFDVNGVLIYPPDFDPEKKYPLVLSLHGGPIGASTEAFADFAGFGSFERVMATQGWLVFSPNFRGSSNNGYKFQRAIVNNLGEGPASDVMSGIEAIKSMGIVDEKRIAVSGWSYGGYLTSWLIGNYQGWTAAVAGAAVTDWMDEYNFSDIQPVASFALNGSPWLNDNAENYRKNSPISYAHNIRTPTLILSNTGDARVPITQSYKLYHAIKDNKVPVQFIAYPIPGHFPMDPVHTQDVYTRWVNWIGDHFDAVD